ncbi:hypothetical protein LOK49_LG09G02511 [Camellia lanceoleosa]|uniref:Uncharacterized protein n=1 Tax=Camellia lanceoleosa TaxID=1840588 RepID=A0ACC0GGD3_9ERIC|nr:hypothetical protein LOK49_LG09G02511 [Camellia lanceoleosa]
MQLEKMAGKCGKGLFGRKDHSRGCGCQGEGKNAFCLSTIFHSTECKMSLVHIVVAVICLDGDGCKIRTGSLIIEEDSNLDTSIACDSCNVCTKEL